MTFDGETVTVGDAVYDVAYGHGKVERVEEAENKMFCIFNTRMIAYDVRGVGSFGRKTLFWRDPIGSLKPSKDRTKWELFERLRNQIAVVVL